MQTPLSYRGEIPFFYNKTAVEYQQDNYERYDEMVVRQSALHLADQLWGGYPMQVVLDYAASHYPRINQPTVVEIGCGVGRWIGSVATQFPKASCWGIDFSYQMLKRAQEFWVAGKTLSMDLRNKGYFSPLNVEGHRLTNLQFGLAKASQLPFEDNSQNLILNSFLLDRLEDIGGGLNEMYRVLAPEGRIILISPLNFNKAAHWQNFYPPNKLLQFLKDMNFEILDWQANLLVSEPLDIHGNSIRWKVVAAVLRK